MLLGQRRRFNGSLFTALCLIGHSAHAIQFEPGAGIGVEFTDNATLSPDNEKSDSVVATYVGASLVEKEGAFQYNANTSLARHTYLEDSFDDQTYFKLGAVANWEMIRNQLNWFVKDNFSQRPIQELTSNTPDNLQDSNTFTFGANVHFPISSIQSFTLVPQFRQNYFEKQKTDNTQLSLNSIWNYQLFRLTGVGFNLGFRNVDYTEVTTTGQSGSDTDFITAGLVFNTQLRRSNFILDMGVTNVKRDNDASNSGFSGSGFTGRAEWDADLTKTSKLRTFFSTELTDTSTVAFSAESPENSSVDNLEVNTDVVRNSLFHFTYLRDGATVNSRYWVESRKVRYSGNLLTRETQAVGLNFSSQITRLLSGKAYFKYNRTRQLETFRTDKRYTAGANLKYRLSRKMNAVFDAKFRKKNSNFPAEEYEEVSFFARLVYGFGDVDRPTRAGGF